MLEAIAVSGRPVGFKASGGIRTLADAAPTSTSPTRSWAPTGRRPATFRFGASSLLDALEAALPGRPARRYLTDPGSEARSGWVVRWIGSSTRRASSSSRTPVLDHDVDDRAPLVEAAVHQLGGPGVADDRVQRGGERRRPLGVAAGSAPRRPRCRRRTARRTPGTRWRAACPTRSRASAITGRYVLSSRMPCDAAKRDGGVVAEHPGRDLVDRLAQHRVDLAGHDRRPGLQLGQQQLGRARPTGRWPAAGCRWRSSSAPRRCRAARPRPRPARPGRPAATIGLALGRSGSPVSAASARDHRRRELGRGVDAGADGGAAERQLAERRRCRHASGASAPASMPGPRVGLLAERHRRGVHQVGAPRLDDVGEARRPCRAKRARPAPRRPGGPRRRAAERRRCGSPSGTVSFDDCEALTWSLGWTPSPTRRRRQRRRSPR